MVQYVLEFHDKHKNEDISTYERIEEAQKISNEVISDPATTCATLTAVHMSGGRCRGDKLLQEYSRTE